MKTVTRICAVLYLAKVAGQQSLGGGSCPRSAALAAHHQGRTELKHTLAVAAAAAAAAAVAPDYCLLTAYVVSLLHTRGPSQAQDLLWQ
eukprot:1105-Heterococcus_DN1.PRE.2